ASGQLPINAAFTCQDGSQAAANIRRLFDNVKAVDFCRAAGWLQQCAKNADGCGFPRTIRSQQTKDFTALDLQIHAVDCGKHCFRLPLAEKGKALPSWRYVGGFITSSRSGREFFDQLPGFDRKI